MHFIAKIANKLSSIKFYELRGWRLYLFLFVTAFFEDFFHLFWLRLALDGNVIGVMFFIYFWHSTHDSYYALGSETWRNKNVRRAEKLGSALGGGLALYLFPIHL